MEFPLIIAIVVLSILLGKEKKKNTGNITDTAQNSFLGDVPMRQNSQLAMSPEMISREADNMRRASESALRTRAEALVARYDQSALVSDLVDTIRECIRYGIIWDITLNDSDISITTMTDAMDNRVCLMTERYDYASMGYQDPPRESEHRLAMALALQKKLGADYGIEYQFQYNPVNSQFVLSDLMVCYRKKELGSEPLLKSPI